MDTLRGLVGPLPHQICQFANFHGQFTGMNMSMGVLAQNLVRFAFIFIWKTIPVMEDNLLTLIICSEITMVTFLVALASKFALEILPLPNEVHRPLATVLFRAVRPRTVARSDGSEAL